MPVGLAAATGIKGIVKGVAAMVTGKVIWGRKVILILLVTRSLLFF